MITLRDIIEIQILGTREKKLRIYFIVYFYSHDIYAI